MMIRCILIITLKPRSNFVKSLREPHHLIENDLVSFSHWWHDGFTRHWYLDSFRDTGKTNKAGAEKSQWKESKKTVRKLRVDHQVDSINGLWTRHLWQQKISKVRTEYVMKSQAPFKHASCRSDLRSFHLIFSWSRLSLTRSTMNIFHSWF